MAITQPYIGTEAVSTTEWSLTSDTSTIGAIAIPGMYQCFLDLTNLAAGDVYEFKIYEKVRSGDAQRVCFLATFSNAQGVSGAIPVGPGLLLYNGWEMTLVKIAGTDRTINWSIRMAA